MDKGNMEMNVHGGEIDDVELDPEKETSADPVRARRVNMKDREDVAAEELYQARRSVGGYLARKIEFLPKFVTGEAYDVVARSAGCSYVDIVANLEDRYGQPATVAAACIEKLTVEPNMKLIAEYEAHRRTTARLLDQQTSSFATDFSAKDSSRRPGTSNESGQSKPLLGGQSCLCCSGAHELASCFEFQNKDLQTRWDIVKRHRLCHVCMRPGHRRDRCESQRFCPYRSDKRHHRFLHNPPRRDNGDPDRGNQTREREQQPAENQPNPRNGDHPSTSEPRSTVQYATAIEPTKKKTTLLHVIPVKISSSDGKSITTYGLLDNGSRGTMISSDVANELGLKGRKEVVLLAPFCNKKMKSLKL
ncbi:hypothetical protein AWC38_SpisGene8268 [Stylophora pistillata]|uniref:CCHC-type domain-containing protein n=1 Tax=Stylophora pistillata TaxID=50429 RepID=A0A2B4SE13_STYPI|nr:hypothetical protein AWC38_SpisGene8268 [Stylophora pistillata]